MSDVAFLADPTLIDPSLAEGETIVFEKDVNLLTRASEEEDMIEHVRFRALVQEEGDTPQQIRFEIFSEADIFFFFESAYTPEDFASMRRRDIPFKKFPDMVIELLNRGANDPNDVYVSLSRVADGRAILRFEQPVKFRSKRTELLALEFGEVADDLLRQQIQYRFNSSVAELKSAMTQLSDLCALLKVKNPSALSPSRSRPQ
jgi:hypothetical protein